MTTWMLGTLTLLVAANIALAVRANRRLAVVDQMAQRLERLAGALTLLTDTTEAGLAAIASEVQQVQRKTGTRATSRTVVSKRVEEAVKRGEAVTRIARDEALSESEIRLHLALAGHAQIGR